MAVMFWQWMNQSFNALVNYTNRNAKSPLTTTQLGVAYVSATASACVVAVQFRAFLQKRASSLVKVTTTTVEIISRVAIEVPFTFSKFVLVILINSNTAGLVVGVVCSMVLPTAENNAFVFPDSVTSRSSLLPLRTASIFLSWDKMKSSSATTFQMKMETWLANLK